jgi:hypothetical protein
MVNFLWPSQRYSHCVAYRQAKLSSLRQLGVRVAGDPSNKRTSGGPCKKLSRYTPTWRLGWEEVQLLLFLDLGTRRGWVVSIMPRPRFTPGQRAHGTHCTGGWVGPRAGLDAETRGKILCPCRGSNPGRPVRSQSLYWLSYPAPVDRVLVANLRSYNIFIFHVSINTRMNNKRRWIN